MGRPITYRELENELATIREKIKLHLPADISSQEEWQRKAAIEMIITAETLLMTARRLNKSGARTDGRNLVGGQGAVHPGKPKSS